VGAADANLKLSEARAAAVKAALVKSHGVDASRLASRGMGSTKPLGPNTTPAGRQNNRRVELIKT
jgi:OmpA-OmpF porin, OOP family